MTLAWMLAILAAVVLLILYYVLLVRAVLEMLRRGANIVLMIFSLIALIPLPLMLILGILMIIIWHIHKRELPVAS